MNFDDMKLAVEALSGGANTVIFDDVGMPSIMVRMPRFRNDEVLDGATAVDHYAFIVNNNRIDEFLAGKYLSTIYNNRAYSLPFRDPTCYKNHDEYKRYCENKGRGWHEITNAEWSALTLWSRKNNTVPGGNTYCGCDMNNRHEKGKRTYDWVLDYNWNSMAYKQEGDKFYHVGRTATGSGPITWNHDHSPVGVADMVGNCWDRPTGLRILDGEINIIPNNDSAMGVDETRNSSLWKAIMPDGTLVTPGTAGTLHYDGSSAGDAQQTDHTVGGVPRINTRVQYPQYTGGSTEAYYGGSSVEFSKLAAASGVNIPEILKLLCLAPVDSTGTDRFWLRNYGERLPLRGGSWGYAASAGLFSLHLIIPRTNASHDIASRCAFVNL